MSVSDGQIGNAATFNAAFASKTANNSLSGVQELANGGSATITDAQLTINTNITDIAALDVRVTQNESDISTLQSDVAAINAGYVFEAAQSVVDTSTIAIDSTNKFQAIPVSGSGGAATTATSPFDLTPPDGTVLTVIGGANAVTIPYSDTAGGCLLNGNWVGDTGMVLTLLYSSSALRFYELSRNQ